MNFTRILSVAHKEWRELTRDRVYLALAFVLPTMMMLLFGYSMSQDVEHVKLAVLDLDKTSASREYVAHFTNGKYFTFVKDLASMREAENLLRAAQVKVVVVVPEHFQERLDQGLPADVQTLVEGTITLSVRTVRGYVEAVNGAASQDLQTKYFARRFQLSPDRAADMMQPMRVQVRYLYNEEVKSIWMMAPDLVLMIIMWAMPILMSLSVVREKETGSIYNVNASTITRAEFMAGKLLPIVGICVVNSVALWAIAVFYFHAPFRGNALLFFAAMVLYVIGALSLGLLASVFLRTQQSALMVMIILGAIIGTRYSGMFIPLAEMDASSQFVAHLFPASYFNSIVEGSFLKGASWKELRPDFLALLIYPFLSLSLGHFLFHKVSKR
ncbi:MAG TPA: ABC transporter permease [Fimbriimonadaceae bacterium]|nr:ABC transporter permease [Fimbriimonadaceae bacterium]